MNEISWVGVAVATVAIFVVSALWYGAAFSTLYRKELGISTEPQDADKGPAPTFFLWQFLAAVVMVVALAYFLGETTVGQGALGGLVAGILVSAAQVQLFQAEGKSRTILLLHIGYFLVGLTAAGAVLGAF